MWGGGPGRGYFFRIASGIEVSKFVSVFLESH